MTGASLAKGFGAPLAVLAGDTELVSQFEHHAETRSHCSPPSIASIMAAGRALELNSIAGDSLRARLVTLVQGFRTRTAMAGLPSRGGLFPVQTVDAGSRTPRIHERLRRLGVETILHKGHHGEPLISFLLTTEHREHNVGAAVDALVEAAAMAEGRAT